MSDKLKMLLKRIKYREYAEGDPKRVLLELMDEVQGKVHHFRRDCWNITVELLADHLGIIKNPWKYSLPTVKWAGPEGKPTYPGFVELKEHIQQTDLLEAYVVAAKTKPWDYLGEIFTEEELAGRHNRLGQMLTPRFIVEFMVKACLEPEVLKKQYPYPKPNLSTLIWLTEEALAFNNALPINLLAERARRHTVLDLKPLLIKYEPKPLTDLDPCTGTGRFLLGATLMYPKAPLVLYGIEIDPSLYRACLVNMAMFSNHPYSIICADTLMIDGKYCGVDSEIWSLGNQWNPPDMSPFYVKIPPPFKFSLARLAKERKPVEVQPIPISNSPLQMYMKARKNLKG